MRRNVKLALEEQRVFQRLHPREPSLEGFLLHGLEGETPLFELLSEEDFGAFTEPLKRVFGGWQSHISRVLRTVRRKCRIFGRKLHQTRTTDFLPFWPFAVLQSSRSQVRLRGHGREDESDYTLYAGIGSMSLEVTTGVLLPGH